MLCWALSGELQPLWALTLVVPKYNKDADPFGMGFWFTGLGGFFWGFFLRFNSLWELPGTGDAVGDCTDTPGLSQILSQPHQNHSHTEKGELCVLCEHTGGFFLPQKALSATNNDLICTPLS